MGDTPDFYQSVLSIAGNGGDWEDSIGCPPPGHGQCSYGPLFAGSFSSSLINNTNKVFVLVVNGGSGSATWGITSCNYAFTTPGYSFDHLILDTSTCTASNRWTDSPGSSYFTGSKYGFLENAPVGYDKGSKATFKHTQIKGEIFTYPNNGVTYTGSGYTLTAETSNIIRDDAYLNPVVSLCYHSQDAAKPC